MHWRRVHGWRAARWTAGIEATEMETNPRATFLVVLGNVFERLECRSPIFWDVFFLYVSVSEGAYIGRVRHQVVMFELVESRSSK